MLSGSVTKSLTRKQKLAKLLNSAGLKWFSSLCYRFAASRVISLAIKGESEIWTRNSYVSGNLIYGLSDIDFTLYLHDLDTSCDEGSYLKKYERYKTFFPFLGEINIYKQSQMSLLSKLINPYELERDPHLKSGQLILGEHSLSLHADQFTYLFRMFLSDLENLERTPMSRIEKWQRHYHSIGKTLNVKDPTLLYQSIKTTLIELSDPSFEQPLNDYLKLPREINNALLSSKLLIYAPQLWHSCFSGIENIQDTIYQVSEATFNEQIFFFTQLKWELFGLLTQLPMIEDKFFQYHYHLPFLRRVLEEMSCSHLHENLRVELLEGFGEVRRLLKKDFSDFSKPETYVPIVFSTSGQ